jgi:hypothetical protein
MLSCPVEPNVGGHEPIETIVDRYQSQMQWLMECTTADQCGLSVIFGASVPVVEYIERDAGYAAEMVIRGRLFMECVRQRREPVQLPPPPPPPVVVSKNYSMDGSNKWADAAVTWLTTKVAASDHAAAERTLKELVPPDEKACTGYSVK